MRGNEGQKRNGFSIIDNLKAICKVKGRRSAVAISQLIGWMGSLMLILAYFLLSRGKVKGGNVSYQILNLGGAIFIGVNVYAQEAWPALFLEFVWAAIALAALMQIFNDKKKI